MKKIKLFLGAYVNFPNAQNINCEHIARYIDKDKFEVHTMYTTICPIDKTEYKKLGIHLHKLIHHRYIWYWCKYLTMLFGKYDIYYLPKGEPMDKRIAKRLKGKRGVYISSIEGVVTDKVNNTTEYREYFTNYMDTNFAISKCISKSVKKHWGYEIPVLPLGVDPIDLESKKRDRIKRVVWVGNIKANKRPQYLIEVAKAFPEIQFTMVGDGDMQDEIEKNILDYKLTNIVLTGRLPNAQVYEKLMEGDLFLMTSENEGLPKVTQEAAQCGLPSIYIGENYDVDFIENGVNGFKVLSLDEMKSKLQWLLDNPEEYSKMSEKARESVQDYLWPKLIKKYEDYFERVYENYHKG